LSVSDWGRTHRLGSAYFTVCRDLAYYSRVIASRAGSHRASGLAITTYDPQHACVACMKSPVPGSRPCWSRRPRSSDPPAPGERQSSESRARDRRRLSVGSRRYQSRCCSPGSCPGFGRTLETTESSFCFCFPARAPACRTRCLWARPASTRCLGPLSFSLVTLPAINDAGKTFAILRTLQLAYTFWFGRRFWAGLAVLGLSHSVLWRL